MMQKKGLSSLFQPVELTQGECWKTILAFSFPIIVSYLLQQVYTISDAAIVGQTLTAQEVAGVNDTSSLIFIFLQFAFGVSAGFCVVTSCNVGAHNPAGVRRSMTTQIVLSAALTVILTVLALLLLDPMLAWINVTPDNGEVYRAAYTYCAIIFAGIGAQLFYNFICSFLRSMGDSVTPLAFLLFSSARNVGLDLLLSIVFRWGGAGAAIATVSAQLISTLGCFAYAFSKYPELRLHQEDWQITCHDVTRHLIQGIPLGLQFSVLAIGIIVVQSIVVQFDMLNGVMVSNSAQNGFGAANKINSLLMTPLNGLGSAMTSFTAQNLGAGKNARVRHGCRSGVAIGMTMGAIFAVVFYVFAKPLVYAFISDGNLEAVDVGVDFLHIVTPFYIFLSIKLMVDGVQRGAARMLQFMIATLSDVFLRVVLSFTLSPIFGIRGVWYSWPGGWIVGIVLSATLYLVWARKLTTEGEKTSVKAE